MKCIESVARARFVHYLFLLFLSPHFISLSQLFSMIQSQVCFLSLRFFPLLAGWQEPGVDLPDGGVYVTDGWSLNHQFAGGVDLDRGPGVL